MNFMRFISIELQMECFIKVYSLLIFITFCIWITFSTITFAFFVRILTCFIALFNTRLFFSSVFLLYFTYLKGLWEIFAFLFITLTFYIFISKLQCIVICTLWDCFKVVQYFASSIQKGWFVTDIYLFTFRVILLYL